MRKQTLKLALLLALCGAAAWAQPPGGPPPGQGPPGRGGRGPLPGQPPPPLERALLPGPHGKWWDDPEMSNRLSLTADQRKKMDDAFQQYRLKLIDLEATLEREETVMQPLVEADQPDENKIVGQIDKVAQARAELEKTNARMLLAIRRVLTPDQFQKLQQQRQSQGQPAPPPPRKK